MKKTFFIVSSIASLLSLAVLSFFAWSFSVSTGVQSDIGTLVYLGVLLVIVFTPIVSLLIGFLLNRKGRVAKAYQLIFIIINIILSVSFFLYLLIIFNFESV
ncbi:hypothetical protein HOB30_02440 [Candidatus Falkowbacteria bacterium]|jgi:hypothetical protein|nr:hypothetical protein [Candidatus Falkowbacteria bacterium]